MELLGNIDKILEKINLIKSTKKIGIEQISTFIGKDKSVTSRILNGKYNLDLLTFINLCYALDENPVLVLNECLSPKNKIVSISENDANKFDELAKILQGYTK